MLTWKAFNDEGSVLPFTIPVLIWGGSFLYCYLPSKSERPVFYKWDSLHNFHNMGGIVLGAISIYYYDDTIFNERITILWSLSYFLVDLIDCLYRRDVEYTSHAVFCIILGISNYVSPVQRELRMNSKAVMCELSSPFLHVSKRTRKPLHFSLFALVFTLCRMIWVPFMLVQVLQYGLEWYDYRVIALVGFYVLNSFWYFKILRIVVNGARGKEMKEE